MVNDEKKVEGIPPPGDGLRRSRRLRNLPPSPPPSASDGASTGVSPALADRDGGKRSLPQADLKTLSQETWRKEVETWGHNLEMKKRKMKLEELAIAQKEEELLKLDVEDLQKQVIPAADLVREKDETVKMLKRRLAMLQEGGARNRKQMSKSKDDDQPTGGRDAVVILPEEVWKMILDNLKESQDLWNCTNTCELFEEILHPWKTGWMLEQALPHLYKYLPRRKLLESRSVCRGWKRGVDSFLEGHPSLRPHEVNGKDNRRLDFVCPLTEKRICKRNEFRFAIGQDLAILKQPYLEEMGNRNPFIGRYLTLELLKPLSKREPIGGSKNRDEWWAKLRNFLITFGKEVWYLNLVHPCPWETEDVLDGMAIAEFLKDDLFEYFPNLRKLSIRRADGCHEDQDHSNSARISISSWDFPPAPKLETLECAHEQDGAIGEALVKRYHMQLVKLHVTGTIWNRVRDHFWPNLKELHIVWRRCGTHILRRLRGDVAVIRLTKLTVEIPFRHGNLTSLMEAIKELSSGNPLTTLRIVGSLPYRGNWPWGELRYGMQGDLRAPSTLTTLELVVLNDRRCPPTYDFLLYHFPYLENIHVIYRKRTSANPLDYQYELALMPQSTLRRELAVPFARVEEFIQVNRFLLAGEMYKSNIWELLPRLKVFSFQWTVYTREKYETYVEKLGGGEANN